MIAKIVLLANFLIFFHIISYGQTKLIKGEVVDFHTFESVPSIKILNQFDSVIYTTDTSGTFTLSLSPNDSIIKLSGIGYGTTILTNLHCFDNSNIESIPVFEFSMTGGTIEIGREKNLFGRLKRKQSIVRNEWVINDSIDRDRIILWNKGQKEITLFKYGNKIEIDLCKIE
jgi:hypothetical protein